MKRQKIKFAKCSKAVLRRKFIITYRVVEPVCCIPETNVNIVCQLYWNLKKKKKKASWTYQKEMFKFSGLNFLSMKLEKKKGTQNKQ